MFAIQHLLNILYLQLYQKKSNHNEDEIRNSVNQKVSCGQEVSTADISQQSWDKHYVRISVNGVMGEYMLFVIKEGIYLWDSDQHKSLYSVHWDTIY